ncbi:hypothetical protein ACFS7Z_25955 [Pontibacter toksunensis]|uniref:Uncharacterized protein n=1 Tax=Pontibacter toksunensis TaxID=1332631 RepID=A0ABW6C375_9BACT
MRTGKALPQDYSIDRPPPVVLVHNYRRHLMLWTFIRPRIVRFPKCTRELKSYEMRSTPLALSPAISNSTREAGMVLLF